MSIGVLCSNFSKLVMDKTLYLNYQENAALATASKALNRIVNNGPSDYAIITKAQALGLKISKETFLLDCSIILEKCKSNKKLMSRPLLEIIKARFQGQADLLNRDLKIAGLTPITHWSPNQVSNRLRKVEVLLDKNKESEERNVSLNNLRDKLILFGAMSETDARAALTNRFRISKQQTLDEILNDKNPSGQTLLHLAAYKGDTETVNLAITTGSDINKADVDGDTPLHYAAEAGNTKILRALIEAGADPTKANEYGYTPLHWVARTRSTEIVKTLIHAGADVNKADNGGYTPLHRAAEAGNTKILRALIEAGADPTKTDERGDTPLHWTTWNGCTDIVQLLIKNGADVNKADNGGYTPLHTAVDREHSDIVKLLIENGANVNSKDSDGHTPLHVAAMLGYTEIVQALIEVGADLNIKNESGQTPLHWAATNGIVQALEAERADIHISDMFGETPLHKATKYGKIKSAAVLIAKGANINCQNKHGKTPLDIAKKKKHSDIVKLLEAHQTKQPEPTEQTPSAAPSKRKLNEEAPGNPAKKK